MTGAATRAFCSVSASRGAFAATWRWGIVHPWFEPPKVSPQSLQRTAYQFLLATPLVGESVLRFAPGFVKLVLRRGAHPSMRWSEEELDATR